MDSLVAQFSLGNVGGRSAELPTSGAPQSPSDEQLLARISQNDKEALALLFRRYAKIVNRIGRRLFRDDAEAEDLVQDFFIYIYRKSSVYKTSKGPANSWIIQTIYYQAFQRRKQLAIRRHRLPSISDAGREAVNSFPPIMEYDQSLEGLIGQAKLREIADCLTEDQSETLRLHFFEGHTLSEVAEALGQSVGNVRHHFYRGIEKFRSRIFSSELQDRTTSGTK